MSLLWGVLAAAGVSCLSLILLPVSIRRGIVALFVVTSLLVGWTPTAPNSVRTPVLIGAILTFIFFSLGDRPSAPCKRSRLITQATLVLVFMSVAVTAIRQPNSISVIVQFGALWIAVSVFASKFTSQDSSIFYSGFIVVALIQLGFGLLEFFVLREPLLWGYGSYVDGTTLELRNPFLDNVSLRVQGSSGHPIVFGLVMACLVAITLARWSEMKPLWRVAACTVAFAGLVLSGSRSPIIALFLAASYCLVLEKRSSSILRSLAYVAGIAFAVLLANAVLLSTFESFQATGSYTNRLGGLQSVPKLFDRDIPDIFFGSGFGSELELFRRGFLQQNGFNIVDNQFVTSLATGGLVGLVLTVIIIIAAFRASDRTARTLTVLFVAMMFSFDLLKWPSISAILFLVARMSTWTTEGQNEEETAVKQGSLK